MVVEFHFMDISIEAKQQFVIELFINSQSSVFIGMIVFLYLPLFLLFKVFRSNENSELFN
jgi:hypothetical protein